MVAVRAEAEDGGSVEATTDADGACTLLLATNTRWNVTFAGAQFTALSILGLRPEAVTDAIPVRLSTRDSVLQRTAVGSGGACVIPSASTVRQLRVRVRNFVIGARRDARQEAGPFACVLRVDRPAGEPANTYDVVYQFASYPNAPALEFWIGEVSYPVGGAAPWPERGVFRRIESRPEADSVVELDYAEAVPSPDSVRIDAQLPTTGVVTTQSVSRTVADRSNGFVTADYGEAFMLESGVLLGFSTMHFGAAALQPQIEARVFSGAWTMGPSRVVSAEHLLEVPRAGNRPVSLWLNADVGQRQTIVVPEAAEIDVQGDRLDNVELRVRGGFAQAGFNVWTIPTTPELPRVVWTGWLFDPPSAQATTRFTVPRLPSGRSLSTDAPAPAYSAEAFMAALPSSQPGYAYHPRAAASSIVSTRSARLTRGDR